MPYTEDGYVQGDGWVPGVDFDPSDPEEMEVMRDVFERERMDSVRHLQQENARLRGLLGQANDQD